MLGSSISGGKFELKAGDAPASADKVCGRAPTDVTKDALAATMHPEEQAAYGYEQVTKHLRDFFRKYGRTMDLVGRMSTISSVLKTVFPSKMWFVGFYTVSSKAGKRGLPPASVEPDGKDWGLVVGPY